MKCLRSSHQFSIKQFSVALHEISYQSALYFNRQTAVLPLILAIAHLQSLHGFHYDDSDAKYLFIPYITAQYPFIFSHLKQRNPAAHFSHYFGNDYRSGQNANGNLRQLALQKLKEMG